MPKGGALLLTNLTPHGSFENNTDSERWSMDLRYQNAAIPTNAQISRLPGEAVPHGLTIEDPRQSLVNSSTTSCLSGARPCRASP